MFADYTISARSLVIFLEEIGGTRTPGRFLLCILVSLLAFIRFNALQERNESAGGRFQVTQVAKDASLDLDPRFGLRSLPGLSRLVG